MNKKREKRILGWAAILLLLIIIMGQSDTGAFAQESPRKERSSEGDPFVKWFNNLPKKISIVHLTPEKMEELSDLYPGLKWHYFFMITVYDKQTRSGGGPLQLTEKDLGLIEKSFKDVIKFIEKKRELYYKHGGKVTGIPPPKKLDPLFVEWFNRIDIPVLTEIHLTQQQILDLGYEYGDLRWSYFYYMIGIETPLSTADELKAEINEKNVRFRIATMEQIFNDPRAREKIHLYFSFDEWLKNKKITARKKGAVVVTIDYKNLLYSRYTKEVMDKFYDIYVIKPRISRARPPRTFLFKKVKVVDKNGKFLYYEIHTYTNKQILQSINNIERYVTRHLGLYYKKWEKDYPHEPSRAPNPYEKDLERPVFGRSRTVPTTPPRRNFLPSNP